MTPPCACNAACIRVRVKRGALRHAVSFVADGRAYSLMVAAGHVDGNMLRVTVLDEGNGAVMVRLPSDDVPHTAVALPRADVLTGRPR